MSKMQGDYHAEREDVAFLGALSAAPMQSEAWKEFARPAEVLVDWHVVENQGAIGSCQGHSVSSVLERLAFVRGLKVQLSEIFAYLATQKIDDLLGRDDGSTIAGGCKLALEVGCPPEALTGYPSEYPGRNERAKILSAENYAAAAPYKALSAWKVPPNHADTLNFIGGGGGINFAVRYYSSLIPSDRIMRSYRPGRSQEGHAMCVLGYDKSENLRAANSHADGEYLITPEAWQQILAHDWTVAIGLMGNPQAAPVDWYSNSPYFKLEQRPE